MINDKVSKYKWDVWFKHPQNGRLKYYCSCRTRKGARITVKHLKISSAFAWIVRYKLDNFYPCRYSIDDTYSY